MPRPIIQNHRLARAQDGRAPLPHPSQKPFPIPGAFEKPRGAGTLPTNPGDPGVGLIVSMGDARQQSLPTQRAAPPARPAGVGPAFVHQHPMGRGLGGQLLMPVCPSFGDVGPFLFGGGQSFFKLPTPPPQPEIDRGGAEGTIQVRPQLGRTVRWGFPPRGPASSDTLCPLARPQKAIGLEPPIEPWSAFTRPRKLAHAPNRFRLPPSPMEKIRAKPVHSKWSRSSKGAGCQEEQNVPASGEEFSLDIPFHRTLLPPKLILGLSRDYRAVTVLLPTKLM